MKAYLLIETKKIKAPKKGEWYKGPYEKIHFTLCQDEHVGPHPILAHHEFEIPEEFTEVKIIAGSLCDINAVVRIIPIPRPKVKVKKTVYLHVQNHNGRTVYSVHDGNTAPSEAYPVEIEIEE